MRPNGAFMATRFRDGMSQMGRPLPTADVGYLVARVGGQLSGGEIARPTGAGRPIAAGQHSNRDGPCAAPDIDGRLPNDLLSTTLHAMRFPEGALGAPG